jgi:hypothetical protein
MKTSIGFLTRGISAELLKYKRTFAFWFIFLTPLTVMVLMYFVMLMDRHIAYAPNPWLYYVSMNYKIYFGHIFLLFIILFTTLSNYLEYRSDTWKNLYIQPVPRPTVFLGKVIVVWLAIVVNILCFYVLLMAFGYGLGAAAPELGFQDYNYLYESFIPAVKACAASFCMTAIIFWISNFFSSIMASIITGLLLYISSVAAYLVEKEITGTFTITQYHPFSIPLLASLSFGTGNHFALQMEKVYYGLAGGVVILFLAYHTTYKQKVV